LVVAADQPLLAELLVDTLPAVSGLNRVQSALLTQLFSGTRWRLGGLSPDQVRAVTPEPAKTNPPHEFDAFDRELFLVLQRDGRLSLRDLAAAAGRPEPTVRRRMSLLTKAGMLVFRTDFARVQAGWPTAVALKLSVTGSAVAAVGRTLVRYPETRFCVAVTGGGAADIFVTMQLHNVSDLDPVVHRLSAEHPGVAVLDRRVVLRSVKSWGRLLGLDGRAQDVVPVDLWAPVS
jgi:DNA-binding Lrp family transcriptional regulator